MEDRSTSEECTRESEPSLRHTTRTCSTILGGLRQENSMERESPSQIWLPNGVALRRPKTSQMTAKTSLTKLFGTTASSKTCSLVTTFGCQEHKHGKMDLYSSGWSTGQDSNTWMTPSSSERKDCGSGKVSFGGTIGQKSSSEPNRVTHAPAIVLVARTSQVSYRYLT
jgi:hypothetical protein